MGTSRKLSIIVDAEYQGKREIQAAERDVEALGATSVNSGFSLGDLAKAGAVAAAGLAAAGVAAQQAYEFIGEGAELTAAQGKFDNLSASINTTGDVLLGKMRDATKGMVSDAQLIAAGTDIMNLGLAKTEAGVVRMSAAVGALNLDMGVLALTLANDSTARLDSLGLSLEDVTKKKKELIASGFIGDAFDEAVLISLEEKMTLLGDASETTAGQMAILESQWANVTDEMKKNAAIGAGPTISYLSKTVDSAKLLDEALAKGVLSTRDHATASALLGSGWKVEAEVLADVAKSLREFDRGMTDSEATVISYYQGMQKEVESTISSVTGLTLAQIYGVNAQEAATAATAAGIKIQAQNAYATEQDAIAREAATDAMKKQRDALEAIRSAQEKATAATGDYFTKALDAENALVSYNRTVQTSGGLTAEQTENLGDLRSEQEKILGTISSLQGGTAGLGLSTDDLNKKLEEQYGALALVEGAMSPLASVTTDVVGISEGFRVNQDVVNSTLYAAADAAGASATELALLGLATGDLSEAQAEAALKSAAMQVQIERLGIAIAEGMDPTEALNRLEDFQAGLDAQDFTVRLGIEVEESTGKAKEKTDETFSEFSQKAEEATDDAKTFFSNFSEVVSEKLGNVGESFLGVNDEIVAAHIEAGKLKDMIIDGLPDEKIIKIKIVTEGNLPDVGGGGGASPAAVSTSVANEMAK